MLESILLNDQDFEELMGSHREEALQIALEMLALQSEQEPLVSLDPPIGHCEKTKVK